MKKMSWSAFCLVIVLYLTTAYAYHSIIRNQWLIAPPFGVILLLALLASVLGVVGIFDKADRKVRLKSWLTTGFSILLIFVLFITLLFTSFFSGSKEWLTTAHSPNGEYTIKFYRTDAGGMGAFGVLGELEGPLWLKKKIYAEKHVDQVEVEWIDHDTVLINHHPLNVGKG